MGPLRAGPRPSHVANGAPRLARRLQATEGSRTAWHRALTPKGGRVRRVPAQSPVYSPPHFDTRNSNSPGPLLPKPLGQRTGGMRICPAGGPWSAPMTGSVQVAAPRCLWRWHLEPGPGHTVAKSATPLRPPRSRPSRRKRCHVPLGTPSPEVLVTFSCTATCPGWACAASTVSWLPFTSGVQVLGCLCPEAAATPSCLPWLGQDSGALLHLVSTLPAQGRGQLCPVVTAPSTSLPQAEASGRSGWGWVPVVLSRTDPEGHGP